MGLSLGETERENQRGTPSEREKAGEGVSVGLGGVRWRRLVAEVNGDGGDGRADGGGWLGLPRRL